MTLGAASNTNVPAAECLGISQELPAQAHLEFLWHVHEYVNEYIRFADAKAAVLGAWASALLGVLFSVQAHHFCSPNKLALHAPAFLATLQGVGAFLSLGLLSTAVIAAFLAILPRIRPPVWSNAEPGFVFWGSILAHSTPEDFVRALPSSQNLARPVAFHLYTLAKIATRKYHWVNIGAWLAFSGTVVGALLLFFT